MAAPTDEPLAADPHPPHQAPDAEEEEEEEEEEPVCRVCHMYVRACVRAPIHRLTPPPADD